MASESVTRPQDAPLPRSEVRSRAHSFKATSTSPHSRPRPLLQPPPSHSTTSTTTEHSHIHHPEPPVSSDEESSPRLRPSHTTNFSNSSRASLENVLAMSLRRERTPSDASIGSKKGKTTITAALGAALQRRRSSVASNRSFDPTAAASSNPDQSPEASPKKDRSNKLQKGKNDDANHSGGESGSDGERNRASIPKRINTMGKQFLGSIRRRKKSTGNSVGSLDEAQKAVARAGSPGPGSSPASSVRESPQATDSPTIAVELLDDAAPEPKLMSPVAEESGAIDLSTPAPAQSNFPNIEYPPISTTMAPETPAERSSAPAETNDSTTALAGTSTEASPTTTPPVRDSIRIPLVPVAAPILSADSTIQDDTDFEPLPVQPMEADNTNNDNHPVVTFKAPRNIEREEHSDSDVVLVDSAAEVERRRQASIVGQGELYSAHSLDDESSIPEIQVVEEKDEHTAEGAVSSDSTEAKTAPAASTVEAAPHPLQQTRDFTPPITPDSSKFPEAARDNVASTSVEVPSAKVTAPVYTKETTDDVNADVPSEKSTVGPRDTEETPLPLADKSTDESDHHSHFSGYVPSRESLDTAAQYATDIPLTQLDLHRPKRNVDDDTVSYVGPQNQNNIPLSPLHPSTSSRPPLTLQISQSPIYPTPDRKRTSSLGSNSSSIPESPRQKRPSPPGRAGSGITNRPSIGQLESQTARRLPPFVRNWVPIPQVIEWSWSAMVFTLTCGVTLVRLGSAGVGAVVSGVRQVISMR